ncbi:hypothetical protein N657DRAFT_208505 [Parathielavia appendiculata]|uniref:Uncharacterized protein n=1 Tax=Parathielavia appendiculata TaxID=2587402 RepID=A0AAN6Z6D1_9PEZI|nr:hypothetical protein N657DRAFT_208505 [Parathielavia appendiculata]
MPDRQLMSGFTAQNRLHPIQVFHQAFTPCLSKAAGTGRHNAWPRNGSLEAQTSHREKQCLPRLGRQTQSSEKLPPVGRAALPIILCSRRVFCMKPGATDPRSGSTNTSVAPPSWFPGCAEGAQGNRVGLDPEAPVMAECCLTMQPAVASSNHHMFQLASQCSGSKTRQRVCWPSSRRSNTFCAWDGMRRSQQACPSGICFYAHGHAASRRASCG